MYWENPPGRSKPVYLDLCLESIKKHLGSYELRLLDEQSVTDYIDLPKRLQNYTSALDYKADYIRYALLYQYGGVWFDCDLILLRDVDEIFEPYLNQAGFVIFEGEEYTYTSVMASTQHGIILKELLSIMDSALSWPCYLRSMLKKDFLKYLIKKYLLRTFPKRRFWPENGPSMLRRILPKHEYCSRPLSRFGPSWPRHSEYYQEIDDIHAYLKMKNEPFGFNLYNSGGMSEALQNKTREQLLSGQSLLSHLFRLALQDSDK